MPFGLCGGRRGRTIILPMSARAPEPPGPRRWGGLAVWLGVGLPVWMQLSQTTPGGFVGWLPAWLLFAGAFWVTAGVGDRELPRQLGLGLLAFQVACVIV